MKKFVRQVGVMLLLTGVTGIYLNGTRIFAPQNGGSDALSDLRYFGPESSLNTLLFAKREHWDSMRAYVSLTNEYEHKRNYGLLDQQQEAQYNDRFSSLAGSAFSDWQEFHMNAYQKGVIGDVNDFLGVDSLKKSRSPLLALGVVAAAYTGRTLRYRMNSEHLLESRTQMDGQSDLNSQYLGWRSTALSASAGGTYSSSRDEGMAINLQKNITPEVSVNYDAGKEHAVGVRYSKGF